MRVGRGWRRDAWAICSPERPPCRAHPDQWFHERGVLSRKQRLVLLQHLRFLARRKAEKLGRNSGAVGAKQRRSWRETAEQLARSREGVGAKQRSSWREAEKELAQTSGGAGAKERRGWRETTREGSVVEEARQQY
eukprot:3902278-Pleurochrysis_carterae.AAC.1